MKERGNIRWPGRPTSGRCVYRIADGWYWQCNLHDEDEALLDQYGPPVPTMQEAFAGALGHAAVCQFCCSNRRSALASHSRG